MEELMKKSVLIPVPMIDPSGPELLRKEVDVLDGREIGENDAEETLARIHGIYSQPGIPEHFACTNAEQMARIPNLEVIGVSASGFDWIDTQAATERGVAVVYSAGAQYSAVAEHGIGLMLSLAKRIAVSDRALRVAPFPTLQHFTGNEWPGFPEEIDSKTIGVLGFGFVGRELAHKCRTAFRMRVLAFDPYYDPLDAGRQGVELHTRRAQLGEMLGQCDFVALTLPLSDETRHIIGRPELMAMKSSAYLINMSRGGTIDEEALVAALQEGEIAGAGLDVFDPEPARQDHPLFQMENTVVTPHIGGWVREAMPRLVALTADGMLAVLRGERPNRLANPEVWPAFLERRATS
ncbi:MAG: 3-phosphoglycerate dehydrogenase [Deltaproteobacteria bacterium]|jgi:phosphoglycerate dehydrogenase-like enzyme|nr:3-phosphoglycerate dehydrogenase [Deltaproteobacteria bacterium]